ncbi:ABC-type sugar transport system, permease component (plasmid) [Thermus oshimai JL-2]|uniref:ABC-type sugar transport system, permease component n=1 Tax=Thermus oshimai JL-2 TaxID=751945 RepID=K7R8H8_THEOS|nr:carbohydrate ABC transporter permease [Thermus oshimai]AFV77374.1 ABC-type sugar transport system, permease component [Thermus oshimai JL-2]
MKPRALLPHVLLALAVLAAFLPLFYQLGLSLTPPERIFSSPWPLAGPLTLENYRVVLERLPMGLYTLNTLVFALGSALGQVVLGLLAAYAFAYRRFPLQEVLFALFVVSMLVPFVVTYLPNYLLLARLGLLNTHLGLILPMLTAGYATFFLRQHFRSFPREILEAAQVDGAGTWHLLFRVLVPANLPALVALGVTLFIGAWNQFIWPLLVANRPEMYVLTVAVQRFAGGEGANAWGPMMAASVLATLPTLLLFLLFHRWVLENLLEGGVRG